MRLSIAMVLLAALLVLPGCGSVEEVLSTGTVEAAVEATVAVPAAPVDGQLHASTPADLPLWPGATVEESALEEGSYSLSLLTDDEFEDVVNGVGVGLERKGWDTAAEDVVGDVGSRVELLTVRLGTVEGFITITEVGDGTTAIEYLLTVTP